jgi:hypothetical protein
VPCQSSFPRLTGAHKHKSTQAAHIASCLLQTTSTRTATHRHHVTCTPAIITEKPHGMLKRLHTSWGYRVAGQLLTVRVNNCAALHASQSPEQRCVVSKHPTALLASGLLFVVDPLLPSRNVWVCTSTQTQGLSGWFNCCCCCWRRRCHCCAHRPLSCGCVLLLTRNAVCGPSHVPSSSAMQVWRV